MAHAGAEGASLSGAAHARCAECGAPQIPGAECRTCFDALLAFEAERPEVFGAVHHLTVATFFLQHPSGYGPEALASWQEMLADALDGRARPAELQRRHARHFGGARRVSQPGTLPPSDWPHLWPMTVRDVFDPLEPPPLPEVYLARAREWASVTRATLAVRRQASPGR